MEVAQTSESGGLVRIGREARPLASKVRLQRILYITYDGVLEPLGYSQVLQYLKKLAPGRRVFLLSFEKRRDWADGGRRRQIKAEAADAGIRWTALIYHKRPTSIATAWDLLRGLMVSTYLVMRNRIAVVHVRSYVPSVLALALKRIAGTRFIFDMRGFWADERVDGGLWHSRSSSLYRCAKWFERRFLTEADAVVSLTHSAVVEMRSFDYLHDQKVDFHVIPTCADLNAFRPRERPAGAGFTLGYVGTAGNWYLMGPAAECFRLLIDADPRGRVLILNRGEHAMIRQCLERHQVPLQRVELKAVDPTDMPAQMMAMDAAVFFAKPAYSGKARAPTRWGELLAAGIPCLTGAGVGDVDDIIRQERVGVVVERLDTDSLGRGIEELIALAREPDVGARCRAVAIRHFSLDAGVRAYARIYDAL